MKKRLLSVMLCICLAVSLIGAMNVVAFAEGETITYTLKAGDTVASVCEKLGIDFQKNYAWITETNQITNYNKLPVGKVLTLPKPGTVLTVAQPAQPTTTTTTTTVVNPDGTTTTTTITTTGGGTTTAANDTVSSYLIPHAMQAGETVYGVCSSLGISFDANANTISKLNNITNFTNLKVGQVLLLPSMVAPTSGTYYKIMAHKVVSGDTVGAICTASGISYEQNMNMLKIINNKTDLTKIKVGETFYVPVPVNAGAGGGGTTPVMPGTPTPVTPTTPVPVTPTPAPVTTPTITYTLKEGDTVAKVCKDLGIDFWKNYDWITKTNNIHDYSKLAVGKVLILPKPGTIAPAGSVPEGGGGTTPTPTPTTAPTATPTGGAHGLRTSSNGTFVLSVNGQTVNAATSGQTVTVVPIPDKGYALDTITVTKTGAADKITVTNNSFVMPDYDVTIVVTFKAAS